ncbi:MAG: metal-dependent hydrolase [Bacillota bacterium]
MRGITHGTAGVFLGALAGSACGGGVTGLIWGMIFGVTSALLPDIDHPGSMLGRVFRPVGLYLEERWGHRESPTHTALFIFLVSLPFALTWLFFGHSAVPFAATFLGGASHIVLDALTRSGVRPWRYLGFLSERVRGKSYRWSLETGESLHELVLTAVLFLGTAMLLIFSLNNIGI